NVVGASGQRPAELSQLDEVVWDLRSEGRDDLLHHHSGSGPVGFSIGSDHGLVDLPGRLDRSMLLAAEQAAEALALPLGQQLGPGVEGAAGLVERVVFAAATLVELLLDPAPAVVQSVSGQADDMEGIHDCDRSGEDLAGGRLEPREPIHRDDLDAVLPRLGAGSQPGLERRLGTALDHVQQPSGPGLVPGGVRSMITVTYLSPRRVWRHTCSSTPITRTPSKRAGSSISSRFPSARAASLAVCQATPSPAATRAIERWSMTRASSAHRIPPRESFARSAAAAVVSSRQWHPQWSHR